MRGSPSLFSDFSGGLNSKAAPYLLEHNQARDLLNVQTIQAGGIVKRDGLVTFSRPADTLTSLYALEATATDFLVGAGDTTLWKIAADGTATQLNRGLSSGARWEWVQTQTSGGQGPLFGSNGVDTPKQWDGAAASMSDWTATSGTVPRAKYLTLHQNYVFAAGTSATPSRLEWCNIVAGTGTDARDWPSTNRVELDPNDGDEITGLGKVDNLLLVFKRRKLFAVYDPITGANRRISDSIGCVSHRSIVETPAGTFFLAEDGVRRTNGSSVDAVPISDPIEPTIKALNPADAAGVYFDGHYYLSFPSDGTVLDYDLIAGSWWVHGISAAQWAVWGDDLYSAKADSAIVDRAFVSGVSTDNGSAMPWHWKGPWLSPGADLRRTRATPYHRKRWRQIRVEGSGTVDFSIAKDFTGSEVIVRNDIFPVEESETFGGSGTFGGEGLFGDGATVRRADMHSLGVARVLSVVVGATSDGPAAVYSMAHFTQDRTN